MNTIKNCYKKVLIISYFFPPTNTIGAVRAAKFAKYLSDFAWKPTVLTANEIEKAPGTLPLEFDERYIVRVPSFMIANSVGAYLRSDKNNIKAFNGRRSLNIHGSLRTVLLRLLAYIVRPLSTLPVVNKFLFDPIGWRSHAIKAGLELIKREEIEVIYSSFGPTTCHVIASILCRETNIPWVADFRDPWSQNEYYNNSKIQPLHMLEELWEKQTIKKASLLITVSEMWANELTKLHSKPTVVIPNGFDEEDYLRDVPLLQKFTITYTGNIVPGKRDPVPIFKAVASLRQEGKITSQNFELRFFGNNVKTFLPPLVNKYDLSDLVTIHGPVSFKESIERQQESTILLLLSWNDPKDAGTLTAKIFEYLGARRPILALAYEGGAIDKLLFETGCGMLTNDPHAIQASIRTWLEEFYYNREIKSYWQPNNKIVEHYTRKEQARQLSKHLNTLVTH